MEKECRRATESVRRGALSLVAVKIPALYRAAVQPFSERLVPGDRGQVSQGRPVRGASRWGAVGGVCSGGKLGDANIMHFAEFSQVPAEQQARLHPFPLENLLRPRLGRRVVA